MFSKIMKMGLTLVISVSMLIPAAPVSREYAYAEMIAAQSTRTGTQQGTLEAVDKENNTNPTYSTNQTSQTFKTLTHAPAVTEEYDTEASRLVVEVASDTDVKALAEAVGAELVRTGPLNYCTLQFKGLDSDLYKEEAKQAVLSQSGVLGAEWSNTYKVDNSTDRTSNITDITSEKTVQETTNKITVSISDPEYSLQWALKKIRAHQVWDEGATGKDVIVAVVDTGVDLDHPDLVDPVRNKNNIVQGYDAFTRSALPGAAQDDNGHGTSVAGVIAALNNSKGIIGIAYEAKIMPIKVMDKTGEGEDSIIADGIIWAVDNGAKIINMSIGSEEQNKVLDDALQYAVNKGCLLVAASGNTKGFVMQSYGETETDNDGKVTYPGKNRNVIAVSAVDMNDTITEFSLTGPEVALAAPGKRILTDYWSETEEGCAYSTGTSIAAPFVSAAAALLWSKYPNLMANDITNALMNSAYDVGETGRDNKYGYGRVDVYRALKLLEGPSVKSSPAEIGWEGGLVIDNATMASAQAQISIPFGTFPLRVSNQYQEEKVLISLHKAPAPEDFPESIIPASDTYFLSWGEAVSNKVVSLKLKLSGLNINNGQEESQTPTQSMTGQATDSIEEQNVQEQPSTSNNTTLPGSEEPNDITTEELPKNIAYLYKWSGTRWLRVGGGVADDSTDLSVTIYEPGIYRAGYSPEPQFDRISGTDRIQTAIEIARQAFPTGTDTVIVARADDFPDALAGAPLAYKYHAPILLTFPDKLPDEVYQLISDLAPKKIFILGGTGAVSSHIENILFNIASVQRISGVNRYGTASAVAQLLGTRGQAVIVNSTNFPDAISAASQAAVSGKPILLTSSTQIATQTEDMLRNLSVTSTEIIGGIGVVPTEIEKLLPNPKRYGGQDRYSTSAGVIHSFHPQGRIVYLSTGMNFPDALTGGVLAACGTTNILLLPSAGPTQTQTLVLETIKGKKTIALGGESAVPEDVIKKVQSIVK